MTNPIEEVMPLHIPKIQESPSQAPIELKGESLDRPAQAAIPRSQPKASNGRKLPLKTLIDTADGAQVTI